MTEEHSLVDGSWLAYIVRGGAAILPPPDAVEDRADWDDFQRLAAEAGARLESDGVWRPDARTLPSARRGAYRLMAATLASAAVDSLVVDDGDWPAFIDLYDPYAVASRHAVGRVVASYAGFGYGAEIGNPRFPVAARVFTGVADYIPDEAVNVGLAHLARASFLVRGNQNATAETLRAVGDEDGALGAEAAASFFGAATSIAADIAMSDAVKEQGSVRTPALLMYRNISAGMGEYLQDALHERPGGSDIGGDAGHALLVEVIAYLVRGDSPSTTVTMHHHQALVWLGATLRGLTSAFKRDPESEFEERESERLAAHFERLARASEFEGEHGTPRILPAAVAPGFPDIHLQQLHEMVSPLSARGAAHVLVGYIDGWLLIADALAGHAPRLDSGHESDALMFAARFAEHRALDAFNSALAVEISDLRGSSRLSYLIG